ncbi:hypothetical protein [Kribbella sp. CA-294648]|uniref:hypothetical protein n=1 Tax=Kribbella sp. CA-294648 TaxID=3239948 RepID=UPI003D8AC85F
MSETEDQSPFGRGFVAACIIIGAVLACGGVLLVTGLSSDAGSQAAVRGPASASGDSRSGGAGSGDPGSAEPGGGDAGQVKGSVGAEPSGGQPSLPGSESGATPGPEMTGTANRCGLSDGEQAIPSGKAPGVDGWEVSRRVVVPRSAAYGPGKTDGDGFRRCFAHSPTGAVYAAYNVIAALADQTKAVATARKLMLPGRDTDTLIEQLAAESGDAASEPTQLAGYRVVDASRDRVTIMLALAVESQYMSATITLAWYAGDWRLVPPPSGSPVGAPYSQHRDLDGFVAWSGV